MRFLNHLRVAGFGLLLALLLASCLSAETVHLDYAKNIDGDDIFLGGYVILICGR